jgi:phosphonopyruvate decarboxylase
MLHGHGIDCSVGVPCSFLAPLFQELETDRRFRHLVVTSEAEAVGIATGAWLAGRTPVMLMQNSGFLDSLNCLLSLVFPFEIPMVMIVSGRGAFGIDDEEQHRLAGKHFLELCKLLDIPVLVLGDDVNSVDRSLRELLSEISRVRRPGVLAIPKNAFNSSTAAIRNSDAARAGRAPIEERNLGTPNASKRMDVILGLKQRIGEGCIVVSTTGFTGRELYATGDAPLQLYLAGSMGCASAVGLGLALFTDRKVVVLDGDGAALMRLGNLATIGSLKPQNLVHVVFNNGVYESTGGQSCHSRVVDFRRVALACGYTRAEQLHDASIAIDQIGDACSLQHDGPALFEVFVQAEAASKLGRPPRMSGGRSLHMRSILATSEAILH